MDKISKLKQLIKAQKLDGYFVPMADEFFCEYVPEHSRRLEFLTGFTGSSGSCLIGFKQSIFETDGRYEIQAKQELSHEFDEILIAPKNNIISWLQNNIKPSKKNFVIGSDAKLISKSQFEKFSKLQQTNNIIFQPVASNLIDKIWQNKPKASQNLAFEVPLKMSGLSCEKKIEKIIAEIKKTTNSKFCLVTLPESVCWLLNIRGADLPHTPFLLAYALLDIDLKRINLYTDTKKISSALAEKISKFVTIKNVEQLAKDIKKLKNKTLQVCPNNLSLYFYNLLQDNSVNLKFATDPTLLPKACKNASEISGIKNAHIADGVALTKFLYWLENEVKKKNNKLSELFITDKLQQLRSNNKSFFSLSFDTIAGFGANGAIIHYRANNKTNKKISGNNLLLLDSGAQYFSSNAHGTTDVTRTIAIGKPTKEHKENFTLVLKGHIAIAKAVFPVGVAGAQLDVLARKFLWQNGKDYAHGTGHGVGHFLNVHEGPQGISKINNNSLAVGMVISNEPGFYKANEYGIRIENLVVVTPAKQNGFLQFETLTQAPIDLNLVDAKLLTNEEKNWLNNYHAQIRKNLEKYLSIEEKNWLIKATKKI